MEGTVYKSTGIWYLIKDDNGRFRNARIRGRFKADEEISSTNPVAVGDRVRFEVEDNVEENVVITTIFPRNNYIIRVSPRNRNQKHILAANLDQALLIATFAEPKTSTGFIDRFLLTAEAYHIPTVIAFNKCDLLSRKEAQQLRKLASVYADAGYQTYETSAFDPASLGSLKKQLRRKKTLFSGHSGVGKSTLINQTIPGLGLRTGAVSEASGKGKHTTTFAEMIEGPYETYIIDTPGVREFGLMDIEKEELAHYFPEMRKEMARCRFSNCVHFNEPGCAVKDAVQTGKISTIRYAGYLNILKDIEQKW